MTFDALGDLNWLAVIVAALAYFAIGAVWYAPPVFGKAWMAAGGMAMPEAGTRPSPAIYLTPLVGSVLSAIALGMLAKATGTDTLEEGIALLETRNVVKIIETLASSSRSGSRSRSPSSRRSSNPRSRNRWSGAP